MSGFQPEDRGSIPLWRIKKLNKMSENTKNWYDNWYKLLLIPPAVLLIFSLLYLVDFNSKNGDLIYKDVSLTGGTTITVFEKNINLELLKESLKVSFPDLNARGISDIRTGEDQAFYVETASTVEEIKPVLEEYLGYELTKENSSIEFSGASLSAGFYKQLRFAIFLAFLFMSIVVFIIFRTPIPSLAVIISAFADIVFTIVTINLLGINLSGAGIIALLMLIGYSVDTDILLTTKVLRKKEVTINNRLKSAFRTGMMMSLTSIAAVTVALIVIYSFSETLKQIFSILLIGLCFDLFNTWFTNASIIKWYAEAKKI
jgi:preprotein translocase subunit SecF